MIFDQFGHPPHCAFQAECGTEITPTLETGIGVSGAGWLSSTVTLHHC